MKYDEVCEQIDAIPQEERDHELTGDALTAFHVMLNANQQDHKPGQLDVMTRQVVAACPEMAGRTDIIGYAIFARLYSMMLASLEAEEWGAIAWPVSLHEVARRLAMIQAVYLEDEQDKPEGVHVVYQQLYGEQMIARRAECWNSSHDAVEVWLPSAEYMQRAGQPSNCPICDRPLTFPS